MTRTHTIPTNTIAAELRDRKARFGAPAAGAVNEMTIALAKVYVR